MLYFLLQVRKKDQLERWGEGDQRIKDQTHEQKAKPTLCFFFSLSFFSAEKVETGFLDLNWQTQRKNCIHGNKYALVCALMHPSRS